MIFAIPADKIEEFSFVEEYYKVPFKRLGAQGEVEYWYEINKTPTATEIYFLATVTGVKRFSYTQKKEYKEWMLKHGRVPIDEIIE